MKGMCEYYALTMPPAVECLCRNELPKGRKGVKWRRKREGRREGRKKGEEEGEKGRRKRGGAWEPGKKGEKEGGKEGGEKKREKEGTKLPIHPSLPSPLTLFSSSD